MKKSLFIIFYLISKFTFSQNYYHTCFSDESWDFDLSTDSSYYYITVDTSVTNNIWQFGTADKSTFITPIEDKVLITDSINPYPINNYSAFELRLNLECSEFGRLTSYWGTEIQIQFSIQTTEGMDGGMIEISHSGSEWTNIINDHAIDFTSYGILYSSDTVRALNEPGYSGIADLNRLSIWFDGSITSNEYDSVGLRFVFASDSNFETLDGWMIYEISFSPVYEDIHDIYSDDLVSIYPNPVSNVLFLKNNTEMKLESQIIISDVNGRTIYSQDHYFNDYIDLSEIPEGIYFLKYSNKDYFTIKKFVVQR